MKIGKINFKNGVDEQNPVPIVLYGIKSKILNVGYFKNLNPGEQYKIHKGKYQDIKSKKRWYAIQIKEFMMGLWI